MMKFINIFKNGYVSLFRKQTGSVVLISQRMLCIAVILLVGVTAAFADSSSGRSAITSAATDIRQYVSTIRTLMYAIAGVVAVVGSGTIFFKMNNGEQDVKKTIMLVIGSCIALISLATALPAFFS